MGRPGYRNKIIVKGEGTCYRCIRSLKMTVLSQRPCILHILISARRVEEEEKRNSKNIEEWKNFVQQKDEDRWPCG